MRSVAAGPVPLFVSLVLLSVAGPASRASAEPGPPRFIHYTSPSGVGDDSGEPSIGSNWMREAAFSNSQRSIPNGGTANYFGGRSSPGTRSRCSPPAPRAPRGIRSCSPTGRQAARS